MKPSAKERFKSRVAFEPNTGCWIWNGRHPREYGIFTIEGRKLAAHRAAWMLFCGEIPAGMFVCHRCDVPACVNPEHLFLGTAKENHEDMVLKGRTRRGEQHQSAKLTETQVREIRKLLRAGERQATVARSFAVKPATIYLIHRDRIWRHVQLTPEEIAEAEAQALKNAQAAAEERAAKMQKAAEPIKQPAVPAGQKGT